MHVHFLARTQKQNFLYGLDKSPELAYSYRCVLPLMHICLAHAAHTCTNVFLLAYTAVLVQKIAANLQYPWPCWNWTWKLAELSIWVFHLLKTWRDISRNNLPLQMNSCSVWNHAVIHARMQLCGKQNKRNCACMGTVMYVGFALSHMVTCAPSAMLLRMSWNKQFP